MPDSLYDQYRRGACVHCAAGDRFTGPSQVSHWANITAPHMSMPFPCTALPADQWYEGEIRKLREAIEAQAASPQLPEASEEWEYACGWDWEDGTPALMAAGTLQHATRDFDGMDQLKSRRIERRRVAGPWQRRNAQGEWI